MTRSRLGPPGLGLAPLSKEWRADSAWDGVIWEGRGIAAAGVEVIMMVAVAR